MLTQCDHYSKLVQDAMHTCFRHQSKGDMKFTGQFHNDKLLDMDVIDYASFNNHLEACSRLSLNDRNHHQLHVEGKGLLQKRFILLLEALHNYVELEGGTRKVLSCY